mmetsp:Transcript_65696/g.104369  ORF Transcript_65696/g.104369 Transcript_65696/m.104369 type:complete len:374 (-) Transcript_65696:28-1149(-)
MAQHQNQAAPQLAGAELERTNHAALCVGTSVARISQHKQLSGRGIKDGVHRNTGIGASDDGTVRCLVVLHESLPHLTGGSASRHRTRGETIVAGLQHLQSHIRWNALISSGAHTMESTTFFHHGSHGRRNGCSAVEQFSLGRRFSKEFHLPSLQMVDPTLELHLSRLHGLSNTITKLQQEIHAVEDIYLHGMCCHFIRACTRSFLFCCLLGHSAKVFQQTLQSRAGLFRLLLCLLGIQEGLSGAVDGSAFGMAQHQNQAAPQLAGAELERTNHAALCVGTSVAGIAQHEDVARQGVEEGLQRTSRISTSNDGCVGCLSFSVQLLPHDGVHFARLWFSLDEALVAILQELQGLLGSHSRTASGSHLVGHGWGTE